MKNYIIYAFTLFNIINVPVDSYAFAYDIETDLIEESELVIPDKKEEQNLNKVKSNKDKSAPLKIEQPGENKTPANKQSTSEYYKKGREAYLLFTLRGYRKAIKLYDKALEINKKDALSLAAKAEAQALLSRELNAEQFGIEGINLEMKAFENAFIAADLRPGLLETHRALSMAYFIQGRFKEGKKEAKKAIEINDEDSESYLLLWLNSPETNKLKNEIINTSNYYDALDIDSEIIDKAIKLNPDIALPYLELGVACANQGEYVESKYNFNKVLKLSPDNEKAYVSLGFTYSELSNYEEAIDSFDKAIEIDPNLIEAVYGKGVVYLKKRDRKTAQEYFSKACNAGYQDSCDIQSNPDWAFWRKNIWLRKRARVMRSN